VRILIAPDKFKGTLTGIEVCEAISRGLQEINSSFTTISIPLADGGEGTCEVLTNYSNGSMVKCTVFDPLFRKITASYGISGDGSTAFIEMARASGLQFLSKEEQNPLKTSTFGTGELIASALKKGVNKIVLAIGGSATNDAGIGMAAALGMKFLDKHGNILQPIGENLLHLFTLNDDGFILKNNSIEVIVLCDVDNELFGRNGAAFIYGPQKGANKDVVQLLDNGLRNFASVITNQLKTDVRFPGAGAAGGLGAGAKAFLRATFIRGIDYVLQQLHVEAEIKQADLIITGEGKMDTQTLSGKVVMGIAQLAAIYKKPVIAITGNNELSDQHIQVLGLIKVISLVNEQITASVAMKNASNLITERVAQLNLQSFLSNR